LLVANGQFKKTSPHAVLYRGDNRNVIWRDNVYVGGLAEPV